MTTLIRLKTAVDRWLIRDDVAVSGDDFPEILLLAESDIARDVHCVVQELSTTLNFTGRSADLPSNFRSLRNVFIDDTARKTEYMTPEAIRESGAWSSGRAGAFYTLEGGSQTAGDERVQMTLANAPTVSAPLNVEVLYNARFDALSGDADTNWLLANHFDVYLYATLRAAAEYIQEDVLEDRYAAKYDRAVDKTNLSENRKRFGVQPKQSYGSPRTRV